MIYSYWKNNLKIVSFFLSTVFLFFLGFLISANLVFSHPKNSEPYAVTNQLPLGVLDVPAEDMAAVYIQQYRLKPDRRFLHAIGRIYSLVTGEPARQVEVNFKDSQWSIEYNNETVGTFPEFPDFDDLMTVLRGWSKKLFERFPKSVASGKSISAETSKTIDGFLQRFRVEDAAEALRSVDKLWVEGYDRTALINVAARAWSVLAFLSHDSLEIADDVPAQALAVLALAQSLGGKDFFVEEARLADLMGYSSHALTKARLLGTQNPMTLYILNWRGNLKGKAVKASGPNEAGYLWLLNLAKYRSVKSWQDWLEKADSNPEGSISSTKTALVMDTFSGATRYARWTRKALFAYLKQLRNQTDTENLVGQMFDKVLKSSETGQLVGALMEEVNDFSDVREFESHLEIVNELFTGPFLDSETYRSFLRGYFYSSFYTEGKFYLDRLASVSAGKGFLEKLDLGDVGKESWIKGWLIKRKESLDVKKEEPSTKMDEWIASLAPDVKGVHLAQDYFKWYSLLIEIGVGRIPPEKVEKTMHSLKQMGGRVFTKIIDETLYYYDPAGPAVSKIMKALAVRLDSRLKHRDKMRKFASKILLDTELSLNLSTSIFESDSGDFQELQVELPAFKGDLAALTKLLFSRTSNSSTRRKAVEAMYDLGLTTETFITQQYDLLIKKDPDSWRLREKVAEFYIKQKQYSKARKVLKDWLERDVQVVGMQKIAIRTLLAEAYYREGKYQDALREIAGPVQSYRQSALEWGGKILNRLGMKKDAEAVLRAARDRYRNNFSSSLTLAQFMWENGRYKEAREILQSFPGGKRFSKWIVYIAPGFFEAFENRPEKEALSAFEELMAMEGDMEFFETIPKLFQKEGKPGLAFQLQSKLQNLGKRRLDTQVKAYQYLREWKGEKEAIQWLKEKNPEQYGTKAANVFFENKQYSFLWSLLSSDEPQVWLLRVAAGLVSKQSPELKQKAENFLNGNNSSSLENRIVRFLLGKTSEKDLLRGSDNASERLTASYFIGWKMQAEKNFIGAANWYHVVCETGLVNRPEYRWARNQLFEWKEKGRSLQYLQEHTK